MRVMPRIGRKNADGKLFGWGVSPLRGPGAIPAPLGQLAKL